MPITEASTQGSMFAREGSLTMKKGWILRSSQVHLVPRKSKKGGRGDAAKGGSAKSQIRAAVADTTQGFDPGSVHSHIHCFLSNKPMDSYSLRL